MNARGIIAHIRDNQGVFYALAEPEIEAFYAAVYKSTGISVYPDDLTNAVIAEAVREFAARHRPPELLIPEPEWEDPSIARRRRRLARRGRKLLQMMTGLCLVMMSGCSTGTYPRGWSAGRTADGCVVEDNCGLYPPYYSTASYCGVPYLACPGADRAAFPPILGDCLRDVKGKCR